MKKYWLFQANIKRNWFDLLLVSQAIIEDIPLITSDPGFQKYSFNHQKA